MSHHHHHHHGPDLTDPNQGPAPRRRLIVALGITASIFLAEVIGAWWSGSLALLADAGHMLVDSSGLVIALVAANLMRRPRTDTHTWGYARAEVLAAAMQAGMLLFITAIVVVEAVKRFISPTEVAGETMLWFGVIGLVGNAISLMVLASSRRANLNMRAAFLEVANDALGSLAVIVAAALTWMSGWQQWDVIASLLIAAMMGPRALVLLRDAGAILMETVPAGLDLEQVRSHILSQPYVEDVHDLHVSTIATSVVQMTAHVTVSQQCFDDGKVAHVLHQIQDCVAEHFPISIEHSTIQIDTARHRDHEHLRH
ncbi:MAG: cation diffusion facilitator family transporter [Actinomycetaceae bacterium]|nr:cation diffusion facilitator family transporter [Actinomycetaceae bacterium]